MVGAVIVDDAGRVFVHRRGKRIVHKDVPLCLRRIIQERKFGHPQRTPCGPVDEIELLGKQQSDPAHDIVHDGQFIGAEQDQIAGLRFGQSCKERLGIQKLGNDGVELAVSRNFEPG